MKRIPRLLSLAMTAAVLSAPLSASADPIKKGYDLLNVKKGSITLGAGTPAAVEIALKGLPFKKNPFKASKPAGLGNTNLKFEREDKIDTTGRTKIELKALSLKSKSPVDLGRKGKFNAFVKLDTRTSSDGVLEVESHKDTPGSKDPKKVGGEFNISMLDVFLQLNMVPVPGNNVGKGFVEFISTSMKTPAAGRWSHLSNKDYPTIPSFPAGDFFMSRFGITDGVFRMSAILPASVSEPFTLALLGGGLLLIGIGRRSKAAS